MKSIIITWSNFQDQELVYPYYRLTEESKNIKDVVVVSDKVGKFFGILGVNMISHKKTNIFKNKKNCEIYLKNFDLLVLPGGVKSLEKLRQEKDVIKFISLWNSRKKIIASTCHGAQLLISANATKGKKISGYYSIKDDINNSGATYIDKPVVVSDNIVSSPHYDHMGVWMKTAINYAKKRL